MLQMELEARQARAIAQARSDIEAVIVADAGAEAPADGGEVAVGAGGVDAAEPSIPDAATDDGSQPAA